MYSQDSFFEKPKSLEKKPDSAKKWYQKWWGILTILFIGLILIITIAIGFYTLRVVTLLKSGELTPYELFGGSYTDSGVSLAESLIKEDSPTIGPNDAKVVIVEFGDFRCPVCRQAQPVVDEILNQYSKDVLFVWRDFLTIEEQDTETLLAILAGRCASKQGKFWQMSEKIFSHEDLLSEVDLKTYAVQIGLNSLEFNQCLRAPDNLNLIKEDLVEAYQFGIAGTPTFIINDHKVSGALPLEDFREIINFELNKKR